MPNEENQNQELIRFLRLLVTILTKEYGLNSKAIHLLPYSDGVHSHVFMYPSNEYLEGFNNLHEAEIYVNKLIADFYFNDISSHIATHGYRVSSYNITPVKQNIERGGLHSGLVSFRHSLGENDFYQTNISFYPNQDLATNAYNRLSEPYENIWDFLYMPDFKLIRDKMMLEEDTTKKSEQKKVISKISDSIKKTNYSLIQNLLLVACLLVVMYTLAGPILSDVAFNADRFLRADKYREVTLENYGTIQTKEYENNTIVISSLGIESEIFSGDTANTLEKGLWLRPDTSTPDQGSNTVIVSPNNPYTYSNNDFKHLDKVNSGEVFWIYWDGETYYYEVVEVKEIQDLNVEIENSSSESFVTLYTSSGTKSDKRILVLGRLIEQL
ncbi:sortase [Candidatus Dojkabacteria bacterium]|uniref:Sortase n=1 Tax=Candidatus Dojkabacteria bacterium TaxID=2099670 RepID=A0A955RIE1_9BACT|nr:sortase [Candidatus Dojkabacteria bacterium]